MNTAASPITDATAKLIACVLILVLLAVGIAGLILPLIPGLLFLGLAALVAARHSVTIERVLRRNSTFSGYLDRTNGFVELPLKDKVKFGALLCLKMLIDGIAFVVSLAARLFTTVSAK